ncbi:MAG TPA: FAD-dependent oxidoreductase [Archangium sp.]|uniref:FAD-dependent oxidoreductase n=1 Tax=Archangium sp. TaxID=1872627 RepID=UPI002E30BD51|nr:FAD-dependent oxidoreductase [Archangium sp.]HEX5748114.1 FAD-dependent oxidoreductase [Archangium sp.]
MNDKQQPQPGRRVAVVGGGAAGVVAAWRLSSVHHVTLIEAGSELGGHARTVMVPSSKGDVAVDMGVELFNERSWPNFCELLKIAGCETFPAPLTFAANFGEGETWENDVRFQSPLWSRLLDECDRFQREMTDVMNRLPDFTGMTIREYTERHQYSSDFVRKALIPMLSTFSGSRAPLLDFSLTYAAASFAEHMLSFVHAPYYRKVVGGLSRYLEKLARSIQVVHTARPVSTVRREADGVRVRDSAGHEQTFDQVVFGTHADIALKLLTDASAEERALLGAIEYHEERSFVHTDAAVLSPYFSHRRSSCEYSWLGRGDEGSVTRNVTVTNGLDPKRDPIFVTINPQVDLAPERIITQGVWKHAKLRPQDMATKRRFRTVQGRNRAWFCGMDTTLTGHESAVCSGLLVADALGANYPFAQVLPAARQLGIINNVMGIGRTMP